MDRRTAIATSHIITVDSSFVSKRSRDSRAPEPSWIEPAVNPPLYCTGLAKAQVRDGALDGPNGVEHVLNLRVALQSTAWHGAREKVDEALAAFERTFDS
jgi:hypothetical protein